MVKSIDYSVSSVTFDKSVPLGINHLRNNPILLSTCGFCQGLPGVQKNVGIPNVVLYGICSLYHYP